jgi:hypothetical protein
MYGAGYLEGWLTAARMYDNTLNMKDYFTNQLNASLSEPLEWWVVVGWWRCGNLWCSLCTCGPTALGFGGMGKWRTLVWAHPGSSYSF